ncbi:hypothetical protein BS50DRAFT_578904 [Corynespora cassiicola Philippines]|uniref:SURP motif domain-containing protein n=1 Tax=Corynespora cassiicola Philippines TaxID=1448308 RepID=A0A2T2N644_CORCC|nr:hypothetical protein BS50DRAFT_578904 [Corynespora cassiicola Philippines]
MESSNAESNVLDFGVPPPPEIVIPPKKVQESIAKSANFVLRKGDQMEEQMRKRAMADPKTLVPFVRFEDPYFPYYRWYLQQLKEGKGVAQSAVRKVEPKKPEGPPEPPPFRFSARMPNISAKDLEVVRMTALYTARIGENWLKELRNRESGNPQFDFLRPTHSFHQYFRAVIDQYKVLLEEQSTQEARINELQQNVQNRLHILDRARQRADYVQFVTQKKEKEEKKLEDERREFASIDWHDFSVVATVTFDEGDDAIDLPPPTTLNDLMSASLEDKALVSLATKQIDEARPDEVNYYNATQQSHAPYGHPMAPPVQPAYPPAPAAAYGYPPVDSRAHEEEARLQAERDRAAQQAAARAAPASMRIRNDYVPRAAAKKNKQDMAMCPNCKQMYPKDELEEHLRIELLDPRWKEQRQKADARYSTVINTTEMANNLKRFASQRDDIYDGVTGMPVSQEEAERRKKAAVAYDGQPDPTKDPARLQQMQSMNVQEQLRRIQERHGGSQ